MGTAHACPRLTFSGDEIVQEHKLHFYIVLTLFANQPIAESYFERYKGNSETSWISLFRTSGLWDHTKFVRCLKEFEDLSLGHLITSPLESCFKLATIQEYHPLASRFQRRAVIEVINILACYVHGVSKTALRYAANSRLLSHIDQCLAAEIKVLSETGEGLDQEPESAIRLASFYQRMARYEHAESLLYRALPDMDSTRWDNPEIVLLLEPIALNLELMKRHEDAEELFQIILSIKLSYYGPEHIEYHRTVENLANTLRNQSKFDEAKEHYMQLLLQCPRPWFSLRSSYALLLWGSGDQDSAETILNTLLLEQRAEKGDFNADTLMVRHNIGSLCLEKEEYGKARLHLHKAFSGRRKIFGWTHPTTLVSARNLAVAYIELEDYDAAQRVLQKALESVRGCNRRDEEVYFDIIEANAYLAASEGRLFDAEQILMQAFTESAIRRGAGNLKTHQLAHTLAIVYEVGHKDSVPTE